LVKRNSQTILNVAFNGIDDGGAYTPAKAPMFWDVRKQSLEEQALEPIKALEEMRGHAYPEDRAVETVVARLGANPEYQRQFIGAFGGAAPVSAQNLGRALAAFQRSLTANNAPFDRYLRGDPNAMTASLRNVELTAPYMHSGVFQSLEDVLEFYNDVDSRRSSRSRNANVSREQLDPLLCRLRGVDDDVDLIAFLGALTDRSFDTTVPDRVPSGLAVGGKIQ
jgi:cytochrome c peroxidase